MKKTINFFNIIIVMTMIGCTKDFVVKNIKNATVTINAPTDNIKTPNNVITFWWDEVDGAEKYNLQIVKPNFNAIQQLIVDTNITTNKFNHTFTPGTYQWRIKATNSAGSTAYTTRTLIIDTTSNLAYVTVGLISPTSNSVTANNNITFSWNVVAPATSYELTVTNVTTGSVTTVSSIVGTSSNITFPTTLGTEE